MKALLFSPSQTNLLGGNYMKPIYSSAEEAVQQIQDGATVMVVRSARDVTQRAMNCRHPSDLQHEPHRPARPRRHHHRPTRNRRTLDDRDRRRTSPGRPTNRAARRHHLTRHAAHHAAPDCENRLAPNFHSPLAAAIPSFSRTTGRPNASSRMRRSGKSSHPGKVEMAMTVPVFAVERPGRRHADAGDFGPATGDVDLPA